MAELISIRSSTENTEIFESKARSRIRAALRLAPAHVYRQVSERGVGPDAQADARRRVDRTALKGRSWLLLRNPWKMTHSQKLASRSPREEYTELARGWSLVQAFKELWDFRSKTWALKHFKRWYFWATRSRLKSFIRLARMLKNHLANILTYLRIPITNAAAEGLNSKVQLIRVPSARLPERGPLRARDLLSPRRARSLAYPHESLESV
jgi:transposase